MTLDRPPPSDGQLITTADLVDASKVVVYLNDGTKLDDPKVRVQLFKTAKPAELAHGKDAILALAAELRPLLREVEERRERMAGRMAILKPQYMEALRAFRAEPSP